MNPGPVEEVGKVATGFMDSMKEQPLALALVVCNLCLLGLFFYVAKQASENRRHEFEIVLEAQKEVQKLLFQCVPAGTMKLQSDESHPFLFQMPQPRPQEAPHGDDDRAIQQRSDQPHSDDSRPE